MKIKKPANRKNSNYLDFVPKHNLLYEWRINENTHVEVGVKNCGFCNRMLQLLLKKPRISWIELDDLGSYIWQQMDGKRSIYDIAQSVKDAYGKQAEPLYARLCEYMKILNRNRFIEYKVLHDVSSP